MTKYFKCTVRLDKMQENGLVKQVSETYLVDAMSHTEAEKRIIEEMTPFVSGNGDLEVHTIARAAISDVLLSEDAAADKYYQTTVGCITLDEKSGKEKISKQRIIVQAVDFDDAVARIRQEVGQWMGEVVTLELKLTPFLDYYQFKQPES